jgi:D-alanyl-D-alanine dipeptidase
MNLIEITPGHHNVVLQIAYATAANITGVPIYRRPLAYLHEDAATALDRAVALAAPLGLGFKIFDAYRPGEAQWRLWDAAPNPDFVADPRKGSPHTRGVAVDLTLIDGAGEELDMGTGFDDFSPKAHHAALDIPVEAQRNRLLLLGLMTAAGWDFYRNEWWHYQLFNAKSYPLISDDTLPVGLMTD